MAFSVNLKSIEQTLTIIIYAHIRIIDQFLALENNYNPMRYLNAVILFLKTRGQSFNLWHRKVQVIKHLYISFAVKILLKKGMTRVRRGVHKGQLSKVWFRC